MPLTTNNISKINKKFNNYIIFVFSDKGDCIILGCGESVEDIHRIHIPEYALEKFTQPDPTREKATEGIDTIVLYATTNKGCKLGPLLQQSLELGGKLKGRGDPIAVSMRRRALLLLYLRRQQERGLMQKARRLMDENSVSFQMFLILLYSITLGSESQISVFKQCLSNT